ncbi:MAG: UbiH/UbiF/VisC/COQ6 family ubiquinone biosynthesis hydroxylase [Candidatus Macondimonas sp.]
MTHATERCDVAIVGGGLVGTPLACALAELGLSVALVEAALPPPLAPEAPLDIRVSAIAPASEAWLRALGIWQRMPEARLCAYRRMHVWDRDGAIDFDAATVPVERLGTIVENRLIQQAALAALGEHPRIRCYAPLRAKALGWSGERARLTLADGTVLEAALVVGADGADSGIRALAGIPSFGHDYDQWAIMTQVRTERPHDHTAWQRFLPDGPLAFLPLADGRCAIVWSCTTVIARAYMDLPDEAFLRALTDGSEGLLGTVLACGPRVSFPLRLVHAVRYVGERVVLVGDAAHLVHPLAGQGVNLGYQDAMALVTAIRQGRAQGRDAGESWVLGRYQRLRRAHNLLTAGSMDGFKYLFGNVNPVLSGLRNFGLAGVDRLGLVKRAIMRQAMGLNLDVPGVGKEG